MTNSAETQPRGIGRALVPLLDVGRKLTRRKESRDEEIAELTRQVVEKLLAGIDDKGMVSIFHDRETGNFDSAIFTAYFKSARISQLHVILWKSEVKPSEENLEFQRNILGRAANRLSLQAVEYSAWNRSESDVIIKQTWDMQEDDYEILYRRSASKEDPNKPIPRSGREKIRFLREILATEIDEDAIERHFGRSYTPGDTRSSTSPDDTFTHHTYWVRDIRDKLQF